MVTKYNEHVPSDSLHHDSMMGEYVLTRGVRCLTYIWYLNDIDEDGYTEFIDGTKVQPKTGRICIFPATWTFIHPDIHQKIKPSTL